MRSRSVPPGRSLFKSNLSLAGETWEEVKAQVLHNSYCCELTVFRRLYTELFLSNFLSFPANSDRININWFFSLAFWSSNRHFRLDRMSGNNGKTRLD